MSKVLCTGAEVRMRNFCTMLWEEDPTPPELIDCDKCGLYKHGTRMVWGEGNPNSSIMVLLDNPGAREDKDGNSFVCGTRQTLQEAANTVGFDPRDLYVTYILKRRPVRSYDKDETRTICMVHLEQQLQEMKPKYIFCLGNVAVQSFFEDSTKDVKSLRGKLHSVKGYKVAVAYHPLAVRRRPNLWSYFLEDWVVLAEHYFQNKG